jgi:hypothetical protein
MFKKTILLASAAAMLPAPAMAYEENWTIGAAGDMTVPLFLCDAGTHTITVNGTGSTDLDYDIYDANSNNLFHDEGLTDSTQATISNNFQGCQIYYLAVDNIDNMQNTFTVAVAPPQPHLTANSGNSFDQYAQQISGNSTTYSWPISVCSNQAIVDAYGNNTADLDFQVLDESGNEVHLDDDATDYTSVTLQGGVTQSGCRTYTFNTGTQDSFGSFFTIEVNGSSSQTVQQAPPPARVAAPAPPPRVAAPPPRVAAPAPRPNNANLAKPTRPAPQTSGSVNLARQGNSGSTNLARQGNNRPQFVAAPQSRSSERATLANYQNDAQIYRVQANSVMMIDLHLCSANVTVEANGNDTTDVDYNIYDSSGRVIHTDSDTHDDMYVALTNSGVAGYCYMHTLEATNLGNTYNDFVVTMID